MSLHTISTLKRIRPTALHQRLLAQSGHINNNNDNTIINANADASAPSTSIAIIDVRDADHIGGHILSSRHIPSSTFTLALPTLLDQLRETDTVVFHCALSTQRGPAAALAYLRARDEKEEEDEARRRRAITEKTGKAAEKADITRIQGQKREQEVLLLEGGFTQWQQL